MKRFIFLLMLGFISLGGKAQFADNTDLGFFAGTSYYIGDVNPTFHFYKPSLTVGGIMRQNFTERYSLRGTLSYLMLAGDDKDFDSSFKQERGHSFVTNAFDFSLNGEFNFLPFGTVDRRNKFSPYLTAGVGVAYMITPARNLFAVTIPFGVGAKFDLSERLKINLEWMPRRTFTDDVEGFVGDVFEPGSPYAGKQLYFKHDSDWYYTLTLCVTFRFYGKRMSCAAYGFH